jgi:Zn-dependent protease with chaperone function
VAILVSCGRCRTSFRAKDEDAGKHARCPRCQNGIEVPFPIVAELIDPRAAPAANLPAANSAQPRTAPPMARPVGRQFPPPPAQTVPAARPVARPAAARTPLKAEQILSAFQGEIEPQPVSFGYRLGIVLVWLVMVLLPACYAGIIALIVGLLGLHAVYSVKVFEVVGGGRSAMAAGLLYLAPLAAGTLLVFFMVKPFFARPEKRFQPRSLDRQVEPLLFAFVDRVCDAVGAPYPARIDVDCQVNAAAGFRRGVWSMFGDDLVLSIGLPLAAGLNLQQFAGVLAHEFGHFSQGAGMRFSYLIRSISFWFTRVVYQRDAWDVQLILWSRQLDFRLAIVVYLARGCIWLTRKLLWAMMMLGHLVSGFLLRQMEFDADRYEACLAGSENFAATVRQLALLSVATEGAFADLDEFRRDGRLGDDLPRLIVANVAQIPAEALEAIDRQIAQRNTGLFDTHPCDRERIANAAAQQAPGIFHLAAPATILFRDFAALSKTSTFDFYRQTFGKDFKLADMHPVEQLLARQQKTQEDVKTLGRYFQGTFNVLRPIRLPGLTTDGADPREMLARLKQAREQMLLAAPAYAAAFEAYDRADTQLLEAQQADALASARIRVKPNDFSQPMDDPGTVLQLLQGANYRLGQLAPQLEPLERWAAERLFSALMLAPHPKVAARLPDAEQRWDETGRILAALAVVSPQFEGYLRLRNRFALLLNVISRLSGQQENAALRGLLERNVSSLVYEIRNLQRELSMARYPFSHAKADPTLAEFLVATQFHDSDHGAAFGAAGELLEGFPKLYARMFGRLAALAEKVEAAFGLPPLAEPAPKEKRPKG